MFVLFPASKDFVALNETRMFTPEQNQDSIFIRITDDNVTEGSENFTVRITQVSMAGEVMSTTSPSVTVTIGDNDGKESYRGWLSPSMHIASSAIIIFGQ